MSSVKSRSQLSGLEFRVLYGELSASLAGSYISNIYSIGESQLLRLRRPASEEGESGESSLVLSPKLGAWISGNPFRLETTEFTTALRSRLLRARLESLSQLDLDRVLTLVFEAKGEEGRLKLVLELMPPGNILLLDADDKVLVSLHETRNEARRVLRGRVYAPPEQNRASPETLTLEELQRVLVREKTLGRALGRGLSIPRRYVDELLARLSHGQDDRSDLPAQEVGRLLSTLKDMVAGLEREPWPCLARSEGGPAEVMVVRPTKMEVIEHSLTLSPLLDKVLGPELLAARAGTHADSVDETPDAKRASELRATIKNLESKKAGLSTLAAGLRELATSVGGAAPEEAILLIRAHDLVPDELAADLESMAEKGSATLASAIFDRAKRAEEETHDIDAAIGRLTSRLKRQGGKKGQTETPRTNAIPLSNATKEWYEKFRWFFTTGGRLAVGGRDAQGNTTLIRRHLENGDVVYHADLFGSPFFILKGGNSQTPEEVREVARATVSFSSAWKTGLGAADAYWVTPEQIAAAGPSGEYLAHGSFAIKGKKNFVTKNRVEVAIGVDDEGRIVSGPEESIMRVARAHIVIVPSRDKPSDTAKKALHELLPYASPHMTLSVDDVLRMLPAGGGKIVRRRIDRKGD